MILEIEVTTKHWFMEDVMTVNAKLAPEELDNLINALIQLKHDYILNRTEEPNIISPELWKR